MAEVYFPEINEKSLRFIQEMVKANPDYLTDAPYSADIKVFLGGRIASASGGSGGFGRRDDAGAVVGLPTADSLMADISSLKEELSEYGGGKEKDSKDANTYFRLMTSLIEKLVDLHERIYNVQNMQNFTESVLEIIETKLDVDTRNEILDTLKKQLQS